MTGAIKRENEIRNFKAKSKEMCPRFLLGQQDCDKKFYIV
jgi:hypothetical protein